MYVCSKPLTLSTWTGNLKSVPSFPVGPEDWPQVASPGRHFYSLQHLSSQWFCFLRQGFMSLRMVWNSLCSFETSASTYQVLDTGMHHCVCFLQCWRTKLGALCMLSKYSTTEPHHQPPKLTSTQCTVVVTSSRKAGICPMRKALVSVTGPNTHRWNVS